MTEFIRINPALIAASLTNPRKTFDQATLAELAESIKATGVHQPVLLRPLPASRMADTAHLSPRPTHELIVGERRLRASLLAQVADIPAIVRDFDDATAFEIQVIENLQREDLSALEEAEGYEALMQHSNLNADQVAVKIGKSRSYVYGRLKLIELQPGAREALRSGKIDASKALLLARIPDAKLQAEALRDISRENFSGDQDMGYRAAAQHVQRTYMLKLSEAKFPRKDETLLEGAGACQACPKRTGANPDLFTDVKSADVCTDPKCYRAKEEAHAHREREAAVARGQTIIDGREAKALMPNSWSSRVDGHLRLDDAEDSPTNKPLRTLLAKQMVAENVQPVLVANPHKKGELVAVLPAAKVAELLATKGDTKTSAAIAKSAQQDAEAEARMEKEKARQALESAWRWEVLEATWVKVQAESVGNTSGPKLDEVTRHMALRQAGGLNQDNAKKLVKLLELGKVAPKEGLLDWIRTTPNPGAAMLLLVMFAEVEYMHWRTDAAVNAGLFLIAEAFGVDKAAIEAQTRANTRAAEASEKKPAKGKPADRSAAQANGVRGGKAQKGKPAKTPAAPAAPKTSPEEARQGIAAAMQGAEEAAASTAADPGAADAAQGNEGAAEDGRADQGVSTNAPLAGFRVGQEVRFRDGLKSAGGKNRKVSGRTGEILAELQPGRYSVRHGKAKHDVAVADAHELELIEDATDGTTVQDSAGADIELGHRVEVVGNELCCKWGYVAGFSGRSVLVQLDGLESEYRFEPEELKSHGNTKLNPQAAWPFPPVPKQTEAAE